MKISADSGLDENGFTLLEVIIAFAILAISLTMLMQSYSKGAKSHLIAREKSQMLILAENVIAEFGVTRPLISGEFKGEKETYIWNATVTPYNNESDNAGRSFWIRVSVTNKTKDISSLSPVTLVSLKKG